MALIKWEPFGDMDRFFDDDSLFSLTNTTGWNFAVDMYEDDSNNIVAEMNLPGVDPENVNVGVEDNHITISGDRKEEKREKKKNYYSREIRRGSFERTVRLPATVKADKAKAEYENGVLRITIPKQKEEKGKRVKIDVKKKKK